MTTICVVTERIWQGFGNGVFGGKWGNSPSGLQVGFNTDKLLHNFHLDPLGRASKLHPSCVMTEMPADHHQSPSLICAATAEILSKLSTIIPLHIDEKVLCHVFSKSHY